MRRFYSSNFEDKKVLLDADETRHLRDVLRLHHGDEISVFDGAGGEYLCRIDSIKKLETEASVIRQIEPAAPESPVAITIASVAIPGDKYDLIVQKAVELGVVNFVPLASARSEVKLKDLPKKNIRWRRIALDAAKQCGRAHLMAINEPRNVEDFLTESREADLKIFFSERDGEKLADPQMPKEITAIIGPKGGWEDSELNAAKDNGYSLVTVGGRIMRAETAAIALTAILQHRFGDIN